MSKFSALALPVEAARRMVIVHPISRQPIRIPNPNGEGTTEAYIDLYSTDSEVARRHNRAVMKRRIDMRGRKLSSQEIETQQVELWAVLTAGWQLASLEGEAIVAPCDQDSARELYQTPGMAWLTDQVDDFVTDRGNFSKASSNS
jgi:hypothetical protein